MKKIIKILFIKSLFRLEFNLINLVYDIENILSIKNFNAWFIDPNNGATYANSGIFLRTDKLSQGHFDEYYMSCTNVDDLEHFKEKVTFKVLYDFENSVRDDWLKKIQNKKHHEY